MSENLLQLIDRLPKKIDDKETGKRYVLLFYKNDHEHTFEDSWQIFYASFDGVNFNYEDKLFYTYSKTFEGAVKEISRKFKQNGDGGKI